ncbi:hypothetical protein ACFYYM_37780 [Streptomyces erythrochromogenes]|uniref:hypothetical protein n=1 Tax=Streptomyces erythrochromogenes TaxID=285574 RepID=UPI0036C075E1
MNDQRGAAGPCPGGLSDAGFEEIATGSEGVHLIRHARGVMVGWMPEGITRASRRRGPRRGRQFAPVDLLGLRHDFGLAMAAALRTADLNVEVRGDEWLLVVFDHTVDAS